MLTVNFFKVKHFQIQFNNCQSFSLYIYIQTLNIFITNDI